MSNIFDVEHAMGASYEEKTAWISLTGITLGYGAYAVVAWEMWSAGVDVVPAYAALFAVTVVGLVVFLVAAHVVTAIASRRDDPGSVDERDRLIGWRAEGRSSWILAVGVLAALTAMVLGVNEVIVAHVLLGSLVLSELVKTALQIVDYRRGL